MLHKQNLQLADKEVAGWVDKKYHTRLVEARALQELIVLVCTTYPSARRLCPNRADSSTQTLTLNPSACSALNREQSVARSTYPRPVGNCALGHYLLGESGEVTLNRNLFFLFTILWSVKGASGADGTTVLTPIPYAFHIFFSERYLLVSRHLS